MRTHRMCRLWPVGVVLGLVLACSDDGTSVATIKSITIKAAAVRLTALGDSIRLSSTVQGSGAASATLDWTTLTPAVATVDQDGLARAVGNGTAAIVARVRGNVVADTATITVAQEAATVQIAPATDSLFTGSAKRFTAEAMDRNGHVVADAQAAWSSSDTTVAAVTAEGLVTARRRGTARIRAAVANAAGVTDVVVLLSAFTAYRDTTLAGVAEFSSFHVAPGVTVSIAGDFYARISGPLTVAGNLIGDCRVFDMRSGGDVDLRGTIRNVCTQPNVLPASLTIVGDASFNIEGATIETSGNLAFGNDSAALATRLATSGTRPAFGAPAPANAFAQSESESRECSLKGARLRAISAGSRAQAGAPRGTDGHKGGNVIHACVGDIKLRDVLMRGGDGQGGGDGAATAALPGRGGRGGDAGTVTIFSHAIVLFHGGEHVPNRIIAGEPGDGGNASGGPTTRPEAIGGNAGDAHLGSVDAHTVIVEPGGLMLEWEIDNARGGHATARGFDGEDAGARPATAGDSAIARGGKSADFGWRKPSPLIGDFLRAGVINGAGNIQLKISDPPKGGDAFVIGGNGGNGNEQFIHGAAGGVMIGTGGTGGSLYFVDNRPGASFKGFPGPGGDVVFQNGRGGQGWKDCVLNNFTRGGDGGNSYAEGIVGEGGEFASGLRGLDGWIHVRSRDTGDAGHGGHGIPPGEAGRASKLFVGGLTDLAKDAFTDGMHGLECSFLVDLDVDAQLPDLHNGILLFDKVKQGYVKVDPREPNQNTNSALPGSTTMLTDATFTIGPITMRSTIQENFSFTATGSGTVSGRFGTATLTGVIAVDATGRLVGYTAEFTFGAGGELPGGQPQKYTVKANVSANQSPSPSAAQSAPRVRGR